MKVYFVTYNAGWGSGHSKEEALEQYRKANGRMSKGGKYLLTAIETPDWEHLTMSEFDLVIKPPATLRYQEVVTV